ncbi:MAG: amino acid permease, partial [Chryseobacterium sp.]|nr:amino acid permease [Chryseobacterium sp.]
MSKLPSKIGWKTAAAIVISNMIGTGIFTTLGFQVADLHNTFTILLLWIIGGVLALFGAFCYAELGTFFKGNGGDYIYLSRTFHPIFGYLSSWVSLVIGFSAPVALAALAMSKYLAAFGYNFGNYFSIVVILAVAFALSFSVSVSGKFHNFFTLIKILFIIILIAVGIYLPENPKFSSLNFDLSWKTEILLPTFASSLIFVGYSYTGWNSASYISGEIENPNKNLPKALIIGTLFVTICYVFINFIMLKNAPISLLQGKEDVMGIAAKFMLGKTGKIINFFIALQLVATISGYLWVGSRITQATAVENKLWSPLAKTNKNHVPVRSIFTHATIAILIILTGSFREIFTYTSFVLQVLATVAISTAF